ncbi:conserved hypothetical protein [Ricinus communis]|uniref:Uncharacterized protein n=1 Tax=Ricinus communis TaxID=3988 RepID=B9RQD7_RICCO|nr:conserved hypothetical protein [Ricinus communis]
MKVAKSLQQSDDQIYRCIVYYRYVDNLGTRFVSSCVGSSPDCPDDAKNAAAMGALDHLNAIYQLDIIDYNFRNVLIYKLNYEYYENHGVSMLRNAYDQLCAQFETLAGKYESLLKIVRKINSYVGRVCDIL